MFSKTTMIKKSENVIEDDAERRREVVEAREVGRLHHSVCHRLKDKYSSLESVSCGRDSGEICLHLHLSLHCPCQ